MLVDPRGYENEQAWTYVKNLFTLVDGKIASSSSNVYKAVADGEMAVGLTYEDPALKLLNDGVDVKVIYPKEGTVFLPGNAAIVKMPNTWKTLRNLSISSFLKKSKIS